MPAASGSNAKILFQRELYARVQDKIPAVASSIQTCSRVSPLKLSVQLGPGRRSLYLTIHEVLIRVQITRKYAPQILTKNN